MPRKKGVKKKDVVSDIWQSDKGKSVIARYRFPESTVEGKTTKLRKLNSVIRTVSKGSRNLERVRVEDLFDLVEYMGIAENSVKYIQSTYSNCLTDCIRLRLGEFDESGGSIWDLKRTELMNARCTSLARAADVRKAPVFSSAGVMSLAGFDKWILLVWMMSGFRLDSFVNLNAAQKVEDVDDEQDEQLRITSSACKSLGWARPLCALISCNCFLKDDDTIDQSWCAVHTEGVEDFCNNIRGVDKGYLKSVCGQAGGKGHSPRRTCATLCKWVIENRAQLREQEVLQGTCDIELRLAINLLFCWSPFSWGLLDYYTADWDVQKPLITSTPKLSRGLIRTLNELMELTEITRTKKYTNFSKSRLSRYLQLAPQLENERFDPIQNLDEATQ